MLIRRTAYYCLFATCLVLAGCEPEAEEVHDMSGKSDGMEQLVVNGFFSWYSSLPWPLQFFGWSLIIFLVSFTVHYEVRKRRHK